MSDLFTGVHTAMVTPMKEQKVCFEDLASVVNHQLEAGVQGLVAVGTTGESPTLATSEHLETIRQMVNLAHGKTAVLAGTGANSTVEAIELVKKADQLGIDAHLQVTPYYNKPNQEGLFAHFSAVAEATEKPILLYSIPGRCVIQIENDTVLRLHEKYPHISGIKESSGKCDKVADLARRAGDSIKILSGDDSATLPFISVGAHGIVSVASNLFPKEMVALTQAALAGDLATAREWHLRLFPLFANLLSIAPNPTGIKYALYKRGFISSPEVRLPLVPLSREEEAIIDDILAAF